MKLIENNLDLYRPDKESWKKSLTYSSKLKSFENKKIVFHCLWRVPLDFSRKQLSVIKSIIVNHDLKDTEINLWSNIDLSDNEYYKEISEYVNFRIWNLQDEIKDTILEKKLDLNVDDNLCYLEGDLFRLLVLHKYGGFYIDMDVLVLRDMSPLNNFEFLYQWGTSGFNTYEQNITMNGAVMRLEKKSDLSVEFLEKILITKPIPNTTIWGNQLYSKIESSDLLVLPGVWFDSEWGFEHTELVPFKKVENIELFEGAFTWHWHNRWNDEIEYGSKFEYLERLHNDKFNKLKSNLI